MQDIKKLLIWWVYKILAMESFPVFAGYEPAWFSEDYDMLHY
jgi:hypothetical protein